jgi:imidazolonepropionase-like amidohydrolase
MGVIARPCLIEDVAVVDVERGRLREHQSVLVADGHIVQVAPVRSFTAAPAAQVLDGSGRFLCPGLADLHVHVTSEHDLNLFASHGVTTVRNMGQFPFPMRLVAGYPDAVSLSLRAGQPGLWAPRVHTAGPILQGPAGANPLMRTLTTPEEARRVVARHRSAGYAFVKTHDELEPDVFHAVCEAAREQALPVVGHVPRRVPVRIATPLMRSMEHYTGYVTSDSAEWLVEPRELPELAAENAASGIWNCPTLTTFRELALGAQGGSDERRQAIRRLPWRVRAIWIRMLSVMGADPHHRLGDAQRLQRLEQRFQEVTTALRHAGARFVVGTDTGNPFTVAGVSYHTELSAYAAAGFTPQEILYAATLGAAECLNEAQSSGSVEVGKRADLLLLERNPFEDVLHLQRRVGVMLRGEWRPQSALDQAA